MTTKERTVHKVKDAREVYELFKQKQISEGDVIFMAGGLGEIVENVFERGFGVDGVHTFHQGSGLNCVEKSWYEGTAGVHMGRFYSGSPEFEKYQPQLTEARIWSVPEETEGGKSE